MNSALVDPQSVYQTYDFEKNLTRLKKQSGTTAQTASSAKPRDEKLYQACVEFESLFIKQMLSAMRKNVQKSDLINGGMSEDIFEDMLYDEYAMMMAKNSHFGLSDLIYRQLTPQDAGIISSNSLQVTSNSM